MLKTIKLPLSGIVIELDYGSTLRVFSGMEKAHCPNCDTPNCNLNCDGSRSDSSLEDEEAQVARLMYNSAVDGFESFLLALVTALGSQRKGAVNWLVSDSILGCLDQAANTAMEAIEFNLGD